MPLAKPNLNKLQPCSHGGINYSELKKLGILPDDILDFSTNCNPFGPPPGIQEIISSAPISYYPDSECTELREQLSKKLSTTPDNLLVGNGSTEIIRLIALAFFSDQDTILIPQPTYGEYEVACHLVGATILPQPPFHKPNFKLDVRNTLKLIRQYQPKAIFLCNPNNPTGQYLPKQDVEQILAASIHNLVILDEAYIAFTENIWSSQDLLTIHDNLVILRSMTKDYALAGLRLGYAIADETIINALSRVKPPWNVNSLAQKAGVVALKSDNYIDECTGKILESRDFLLKELAQLGLKVVPSQTNFFLIRVNTDAFKFRQALLNLGIMVRDCTSFGLPNHIRIAPRSREDCQNLIGAIKELLLHSHAS